MISLKAYKEWKDLFNENVSHVWLEEPIPILKKLSMLLLSIKNEIKKIEVKVDEDVSNLRKNVNETAGKEDILSKVQPRGITNNNNKENVQLRNVEISFSPTKNLPGNVKVASPEIFQNVEAPALGTNDSAGSIIISDEDTPSTFTNESPEIKKKKRNPISQKRSQRWRTLQGSDTSTMSLLRDLHGHQDIDNGSQQNNEKQEMRKEAETVIDDKSSMDFFKGLLSHTEVASNSKKENDNSTRNSNKKDIVLTPVRHDHDADLSVVQCTPVQVSLPKRKDKSSFLSKKKFKTEKSTTLTQMFSRKESKTCQEKIIRLHETNYDSDETYFDPTQGSKNKTSKTGSVMGITRMVSYLNTNSPIKEKDENEAGKAPQRITNLDPSTQQIANFVEDIRYEDFADTEGDGSLNSAIVEDSEEGESDVSQRLNDFLAKAQNVPEHQLEAEPVVRGKARQKLPGWSCKDCEKFYLKQGLKPEEILALNNKCSKHRGFYKPREDTLPGFWDMNLVTQETKNTK